MIENNRGFFGPSDVTKHAMRQAFSIDERTIASALNPNFLLTGVF